jgi:hypothetical protein
MILLEPAYKILHATVKFKRRTISVTPFLGQIMPAIPPCQIRLSGQDATRSEDFLDTPINKVVITDT